ncbi:MAG: hypothetical protein E7337_00760 [Clostridiales bacterium]|nr:hypothetical protein [Clostridiales bacterium]
MADRGFANPCRALPGSKSPKSFGRFAGDGKGDVIRNDVRVFDLESVGQKPEVISAAANVTGHRPARQQLSAGTARSVLLFDKVGSFYMTKSSKRGMIKGGESGVFFMQSDPVKYI